MCFYSKILLFIFIAASFAACSVAPKKTLTPLETLKEYGDAYKKKDFTTMKLLLSQETLKMHEQEAKAQNTTVDEIVKRETLFSENQKTADFRNQKIEDASATIEMKDSTGIWNTVHFVKEDGVWKIDRKSDADKIQREVEQKQNELDQIINQGRIDNTNVNTNANVNTNINTNANTNAIPNTNTQP
jgi:Domain of unknown function (DUF4878)